MERDLEIERVLRVRLLEPEINDKAQLLAAEYDDYCKVEEEKKSANAEFKERLDDHRKEMGRLKQQIMTRSEPRPVRCKWVNDLDHNEKHLVRSDTGEVIETQTIQAEERQQSLLS